MDMLNRRAALLMQPNQTDSAYSVLFMALAVVVNFLVALWFGYTTPVDRYKKDEKKCEDEMKKDLKDDLKKHD